MIDTFVILAVGKQSEGECWGLLTNLPSYRLLRKKPFKEKNPSKVDVT